MNKELHSQKKSWSVRFEKRQNVGFDQVTIFYHSIFSFNVLLFKLTVAHRTTDQANIVGETAVGSANELGQKTAEGLENVGASTGMVNPVSDSPRPPLALDTACF